MKLRPWGLSVGIERGLSHARGTVQIVFKCFADTAVWCIVPTFCMMLVVLHCSIVHRAAGRETLNIGTIVSH
jgi:hypothetical protein